MSIAVVSMATTESGAHPQSTYRQHLPVLWSHCRKSGAKEPWQDTCETWTRSGVDRHAKSR